MTLRKPKALTPNATIAIVAASSWFDRDLFLAGVEQLQAAGFKVVYRQDIFERHNYLAGTDVRRAEEFRHYLNDPSVDAIFFARGGYGAQRLIPLLGAHDIPAAPKLILGYSDVTVLLNYLYNRCNWATFYGPTVAKHFGLEAPPENLRWLLNATTNNLPLGPAPMQGCVVVKPGKAKGRVAGGCLTLVQMGIGTPYDVETEDSILFLEDRGEKLYEIDRMLQHLKHAGKLDEVKGIVFGSMLLHPQDTDKAHELVPMLQEILADFHGPVIAGFSAGHTDPFFPIPLGVTSTLSTEPLDWNFTEAACL